MKLRNKYFILRHGQAVSNVRRINSSWPEKFENPLTEKGIETIKEVAEKLKNNYAFDGKKLDFIFSSDLLRTKQTSQIISQILGIEINFDQRLREIDFGEENGSLADEIDADEKKKISRIKNTLTGGESYEQVAKRMINFLNEMENKYEGKNILIVSHECPLWILESLVKAIPIEEYLKKSPKGERIKQGELRELN